VKLNLSIIRDYLETPGSIKLYGHTVKSRLLDRPRLYTTGAKMHSGQLYVAHVDALPGAPECTSCTVICTGGKIPAGWLHSSAAILSVSGFQDVASLFQAVQEVFDKFQVWELALAEELAKDSDFDICQVIRLGISILQNPFAMMDSAMQIIFSSRINGEEIIVDDHPQTLDLAQTLSIKKACHQERIIRVPYLSAVDMAQNSCYCYNLYPLGHFAGCAYLYDACRKFRDSDFALADFFFPIFQRAYQKHLRTIIDTESPKVTALRKLLKHKPITSQEYELLKLEPGEYWLCFKLREKDLGHSMPKDYMYATLSALLPGTVYATFLSGSIVGLLKLREGDEEMETFRELLEQMDYFCGLSNPFTQLQKLEDCLHQAEFIVDTFSLESTEQILAFQDCLLPYFLKQCCGKLPAQELEVSGIRSLRTYDARKGTEYLKTLEAYLDNERSISRTAEALYIHRSSLLKRLDKISRLTGFDLDSADTRLYLRIYFRLMKQ